MCVCVELCPYSMPMNMSFYLLYTLNTTFSVLYTLEVFAGCANHATNSPKDKLFKLSS